VSANEKLLSDEILQDARTKAERALKKADRQAKKIIADAERDAEASLDKAREAARQRAQRIANSIIASLEQEVRRDRLDAQETELSKLFDSALDRLHGRSGYDAAGVLAGLAAETVKALGGDSVILGLAEQDRSIADEAWLNSVRQRAGYQGALTVDDTPADIAGGVVARSGDGRRYYDNSYAARLRRQRTALRQDIATQAYAAE